MMSRLELAALDAVCCAMDEERRAAAITSRAWGLGFEFDRQGGFVSSVPISSGASLAMPLSPAGVIAPAVPVEAPARVSMPGPAADLPADVCASPAGGKLSGPAATGPVPLCVWCALERAISGHGSAPRINGDVWLKSCPEHEERPGITSPISGKFIAPTSPEAVTNNPTARRAEAPACDRAPGSPKRKIGRWDT